jgi:hypothetical protein
MAGRFIPPSEQYLTDSGDILSGGKLFFYDSGTAVLKNTFSDPDGTTANTNPVILDGAGRTPNIFLDGAYKLIIKDADDVQIEERDPVLASDSTTKGFGAWNAVTTYSINDIVRASNNFLYKSLANSNQNNEPSATAAKWTQTQLLDRYNVHETYIIGDVVIDSIGDIYRSLANSNTGNTPSSSPTDWSNTASGAFGAENILTTGTLGAGATTVTSLAATTGDFSQRLNALSLNVTHTSGVLTNHILGGISGVSNGFVISQTAGNALSYSFSGATGGGSALLSSAGALTLSAGLAATTGTFSGNIDASGGGINLGGTAAANLLDDYEEGDWTPTLVTGTVVPSNTHYTKVGRLVTITATLTTFSNTTDAADVLIQGLPFATASGIHGSTGSAMIQLINSGGGYPAAYMESSSQVFIYACDISGGSYAPVTHANLSSSAAVIIFSMTYTTNL